MNIFVSNLSATIEEDNLKNAFEEFGTVSSAKIIKDHTSGLSRGFGFVEMPNDEEAIQAIDELDSAEWDGKILKVSKAKPKTTSYDGGNHNEKANKRNFGRY